LLTHWWIGIIIWFAGLCFVTCIYGASNLIDCTGIYNWNDSIISSYYLIWTNVQNLKWLTFILFIIVNYTFSYYLSLTSSYYVTLLLSCLVISFSGLLDNTNLNWPVYIWTNVYYHSNSLLHNSLNRYHPFLFYTAVVFLVNYCVVSYLNTTTKHTLQYLNIRTGWFKLYLIWVTLFATISVYLGAWWAFQEGTWGGWWNSDSSEMLGVVLLLFVLRSLHKLDTWLYKRGSWFQNNNILLNFLMLYFFLQISYQLTSHNFDIKVFFFLNTNTFFELSITILVIISRYLYKNVYEVKCYAKVGIIQAFSTKTRLQYLLIFGFTHMCVSWVFISLAPLVSMIIFQYKYEIGWGLHCYYLWILILFALTVICTFWTIDVYLVTNTIFLTAFRLPSVLYTFVNFKTQISNWVVAHWFLILFLFMNLLNRNLNFMFFDVSSCYRTTLFDSVMYFSQSLSYACDGGYFYKNWLIGDSKFITLNIWTVFDGSTCAIDTQTLLVTNKYTMEYVYYLYDFLTLKLFYENNSVSTLNIVFLAVITFTTRHLLLTRKRSYY
jgi:hypothetical protein